MTDKPLPTFEQMVRAVRKASGDKRRFTERPYQAGWYTFKYEHTDWGRFSKAKNALLRLEPARPQFTALECLIKITYLPCKYCKAPHHEHIGKEAQCIFASTHFAEDLTITADRAGPFLSDSEAREYRTGAAASHSRRRSFGG